MLNDEGYVYDTMSSVYGKLLREKTFMVTRYNLHSLKMFCCWPCHIIGKEDFA